MTLQIIGSGFGRTGTRTLKDVLERLGFGPCHHMMEIFANPQQVAHWSSAAAGRPVDWPQAFDGYASQVDWPGAHVWKQLHEAFPEAKVLHSHRPVDVWWGSFSKTIGKLMRVHDEMDPPPHAATAKAAYAARLADVRATVPPEQLLVYDVAEGWAPLCAFLAVPMPAEPFPHLNRRAQFWESLGGEPA